MRRLLLGLVLAGLVIGIRASAHHSFAKFYFEDQTTSIEGEVVEFQYRNPHIWLYIDVEDTDGEHQRFAAEWSNPTRLGRQGILKETFKPGDYVVLTGSPGRSPEDQVLHLKRIERPSDGLTWVGGRDRNRRRSRR